MPNIVIAAPCFSWGKASSSTAWLEGCSPPPASPCSTRNAIRAIQAGGHPAQRRRQREDRDREQEIVSPAEPRREPAGDRQDDGVGGQVAGDDPLAVGGGSRQPAGDVAQGDIGDRRVQHLHEGRDHHRDGDQPRIDRPIGQRNRRPLRRSSTIRLAARRPALPNMAAASCRRPVRWASRSCGRTA